MKKLICSLLAVFLCFIAALPAAAGTLPYDSYIYDKEENPLSVPAPYTTERVLSGFDLNAGELRDVSDLVYKNGRIYICDSGNNRILIVNEEFELLHIIKEFNNGGNPDAMKAPTGLHVDEGELVVADSLNARLLVFSTEDFSLVQEVKKPEINVLDSDYEYLPVKVARDTAGRFYVVDENINQGLIRLDRNGNFISFTGAPIVTPRLDQLILRRFYTKAQRERMFKIVPTTYSSVLIDSDGFLYAASSTSSTTPVVRLNSKGENILPSSEGYGDAEYIPEYGTSLDPYFVDVTIDDAGSYFLLDSAVGRIYAYSADGDLLYVFGTNAYQQGAFYSAAALEIMGNRLLISDRSKGTVTVFRLTDFGAAVNDALYTFRQGEYEKTEQLWNEVETIASNYILATVGLARIDLEKGEYTSALAKLYSIRDHENYSRAFEKERSRLLRAFFLPIGAVLILLVILFILALKILPKLKPVRRMLDSRLYKQLRYGDYVMFHPFDGFWDIKREGRGSARSATVILALFTVLYALRAQYSGYTVTKTVSSDVSPFYECAMILLPLAFWIIANWCFTTLMDGKGSLKDIYTVTCYALKPYVWLSLPLLLLSHVLTDKEAMFYFLLDRTCVIWILGLIFFGMITIHDYSLSKGLLAGALSVIGIMLIIFILLLSFSILQNFWEFVSGIYKEIALRQYT